MLTSLPLPHASALFRVPRFDLCNCFFDCDTKNNILYYISKGDLSQLVQVYLYGNIVSHEYTKRRIRTELSILNDVLHGQFFQLQQEIYIHSATFYEICFGLQRVFIVYVAFSIVCLFERIKKLMCTHPQQCSRVCLSSEYPTAMIWKKLSPTAQSLWKPSTSFRYFSSDVCHWDANTNSTRTLQIWLSSRS